MIVEGTKETVAWCLKFLTDWHYGFEIGGGGGSRWPIQPHSQGGVAGIYFIIKWLH